MACVCGSHQSLCNADMPAAGDLGELLCAARRCGALAGAKPWATAALVRLHGSQTACQDAICQADLHAGLQASTLLAKRITSHDSSYAFSGCCAESGSIQLTTELPLKSVVVGHGSSSCVPCGMHPDACFNQLLSGCCWRVRLQLEQVLSVLILL